MANMGWLKCLPNDNTCFHTKHEILQILQYTSQQLYVWIVIVNGQKTYSLHQFKSYFKNHPILPTVPFLWYGSEVLCVYTPYNHNDNTVFKAGDGFQCTYSLNPSSPPSPPVKLKYNNIINISKNWRQ